MKWDSVEVLHLLILKILKKIVTHQKKKKKAVKYSRNSDIAKFKESLKISNTEEGFDDKKEFNQYIFRKSDIASTNSGECCKIKAIKSW